MATTMQVDNDSLQLTSQSMTIDPSVIQSRILQSASIQKAQAAGEQPHFPELTAVQATGGKIEYRRVRCPPHRYTPLREHWEQILTPLVEYLKLQVRLSTKCSSYRFCLPAKDEDDPKSARCNRVVLGYTTQIFSRKPRMFKEEMGRCNAVV